MHSKPCYPLTSENLLGSSAAVLWVQRLISEDDISLLQEPRTAVTVHSGIVLSADVYPAGRRSQILHLGRPHATNTKSALKIIAMLGAASFTLIM